MWYGIHTPSVDRNRQEVLIQSEVLVTKRRTQYYLAGGVLLLCGVGAVYLWRSGFFTAITSVEAMRAYIDQFAPYSHLCFFLL